MAEPLLLVAALSALSLAMTALFDLLAGRRSWPRKVAWALLVVGLPVIGPVLYYLHAPHERPLPPARSSRAHPGRRDQERAAAAPAPDEPEGADDRAANVDAVDRDHAQPSPRP